MAIIPSWPRFLLHVPVGVLAGEMLRDHPPVGAAFTAMFALYEYAEHGDIGDMLWKDVNGYLAGVALDYGIHRLRERRKRGKKCLTSFTQQDCPVSRCPGLVKVITHST